MKDSPTPPPDRTFMSTARSWLLKLDSPLGFVLVVWTLGLLYFGAVEWRVRTIVDNPDYRAKIARQVRPALVFDAKGILLADHGALSHLQSVPTVELDADPTNSNYARVLVRPKEALRQPPILEALDLGSVSIEVNPLPGIEWEIRVSSRLGPVAPEAESAGLEAPRFQLEISPE